MPAFFAFLHHLAAFALVSALAVEFVLKMKSPFPRREGEDEGEGVESVNFRLPRRRPRVDLSPAGIFVMGQGAESRTSKIRAVMHWELAGVVLPILCAALMARGVGQLA